MSAELLNSSDMYALNLWIMPEGLKTSLTEPLETSRDTSVTCLQWQLLQYDLWWVLDEDPLVSTVHFCSDIRLQLGHAVHFCNEAGTHFEHPPACPNGGCQKLRTCDSVKQESYGMSNLWQFKIPQASQRWVLSNFQIYPLTSIDILITRYNKLCKLKTHKYK